MKRWPPLAAVALAVAALHAQGADLVDAWRAAQTHDPAFVAAQAAREAGLARREQGAALWRPTLQFSGAAGWGSNDSSTNGARFSAPGFGTVDGASFDTSVNGGNLWRWSVQARQPLFSRERDASKRQLELAADAAEIEWQAGRQALMLRTVERYFDAALAAESLRVLQRQQQAVQRALAESRDRYKLGDAPVTDTHEAQARAEAVRAEVLAAESALELGRAALADLTGWSTAELAALALPGAASPAPQLLPLAESLADAKAGNLQLKLLAAQTGVARQEAAKHGALAAPSVDLVAMAAQDRLSGNGDFGSASNAQNNAMIGVQLTVPLYTGGMRSARELEAQRLADRASAEGDHQALQVAQATRAAWLGLTVGAARLKALEDALQATRSRLEATRLGRQVGDRTTLELLGAENDAAAAELRLHQARVTLLLDQLRLAALSGRLDEAQLQVANSHLRNAP
jgi:outer membrane protein